VHLMRLGDIHQGKQRADGNTRHGLFVAFARGTGFQCFAVLHESGRHRPVATPGFDGAAADQDPPLVFRHAANHQFGVLVMHHVAGGAQAPREMVPGRGGDNRLAAAIAAEMLFHHVCR
jgi:hypothetical protein